MPPPKRTGMDRVRRAAFLLAALIGASVVTSTPLTGGSTLSGPCPCPSIPELATSSVLTRLERRTDLLELTGRSLQALHDDIAPLVRALDTRTTVDRSRLPPIALALVREGREAGIDPRLLLAVMLVENPWLDPEARSYAGAIGLMQVMPFHAGHWGCAGADLTDLNDNVCHGARILANALELADGDLTLALLRYNGCVRRPGEERPCGSYPQWVYRRAGPEWMSQILREMPVRGVTTAATSAAASPLG